MDAFASLASALAWPITTLVIVFVLRSEIRGILARLSHLKLKDAEATFGQELRKAEKDIEKIAAASPSRALPAPAANMQPEFQRLRHLGSVSPRSGIMEGYLAVETALFEAATTLGIHTRGYVVGGEVIDALVVAQIFDANHRLTFERIRRLRNQAAHAAEFQIPIDEVEQYIDLCLRYVEEIKIGVELWKAGRKG